VKPSKYDLDDLIFGAESVTSQVQAKLNALGFGPLAVDGSAGPKTSAAIKTFQTSKGLFTSGTADAATLTALGIAGAATGDTAKALAAMPPSPIPGLQASVVDAIPRVFAPWEGQALPYMYTDSKGYVTTGTGNLIDPIGAALVLPWKNADGSPATQDQITDAWNTVKKAWPNTQSNASQSLTSIRLDKYGLNQLMLKTIKGNHDYFVTKYPAYVAWPADAQMVLHSIAWAWGPGFARVWGGLGTQFDAAVNAKDFKTASTIMRTANKKEESINSGIVPRNIAGQQMFENAAMVLAHKGDVAKLYYPTVVTAKMLRKSLWGTLGWTGSGAAAGFMVGGPIGAALGAGVGGAIGLFRRARG
jgi:peptidoglycan hydrolase-like protein with peptidoglycan-binding domain